MSSQSATDTRMAGKRVVPLAALKKIIDELELRNITYAMIHGREVFESGGDASDIDLVFADSPRYAMEPILLQLEAEGVFQIVQKLHYDVPHCYYYILSVPDSVGYQYLHLDCMNDPVGINGYYFPANELLIGRLQSNGVYAPTPCAELLYLLVKKARKGGMSISTRLSVESLYKGDKQACRDYLLRYFNQHIVASICDALESGGIGQKDFLLQVFADWCSRRFSDHRFLRVKRLIYQGVRGVRRILYPSGLFVVFLGPDGAGKSTIATTTLQSISHGFRRTKHFHWRPGLLPRPRKKNGKSRDNDDSDLPSLKSKYGPGMSLVRFLYYYVDFVIGYWVKIYPVKIATGLIFGERYYFDILVHPERYGFDLPVWFLRGLMVFVPKPDLTILLGCDPEVIVERKAELPIDEVDRQLTAYRQLVAHIPGGIELSTEVHLRKICQLVEGVILRETAARTRAHR